MAEFVHIVEKTRDALRRIRGAVDAGQISTDEMQEYAHNVNDRFAKALLESLNKTNLLKEEDQQPFATHVENLNTYVGQLFTDAKLVSHHHKPTQLDILELIVDIIEAKKNQLPNPTSLEIVALLSTGALMMATLAYLTNIKVYYAAVGEDRRTTYLPELDLRMEKELIVIDDILGEQARAVVKKISTQYGQLGNNIELYDLMRFNDRLIHT